MPKKSFAGSIGIFGMGDAKMLMRKGEEFKLSLDITARLKECVKKQDKACSIKVIPLLSKEQQKKMKRLTQATVGLQVF